MTRDLISELDAATKAAKAAGKILMEHYGKVTPRYKKDRSIVTDADVLSENRIMEILRDEFSDYSFLAEESGLKESESEYKWIIDPLDGTTNYAVHNPFFNVSIALAIKDEPVLGVVYSPFQDELFHAVKGEGAFLNDERTVVSKIDSLKNAFIGFCHGTDDESIDRISTIFPRLKRQTDKARQVGAAELELSYTGAGRFDGFLMIKQNPWDVASGTLIVREAGGKVTDIEGKEFTLSSKDAVASNGLIHKEFLGMLRI